MLIKEKPLRHWIDHFYGYGSWEAPIWFVAFEDGGGDLPEEVAEKLTYFDRMHGSVSGPTLCDIRELYRNSSVQWPGPKADLIKNLHDFRFGENATLSGVWKTSSHLHMLTGTNPSRGLWTTRSNHSPRPTKR